MNDLERYLKQASRGLPRRERERVREELRSSILERAAEHQVGGASEQEALQLALCEFGDPAPLGVGMRRIHLWPQVGFFGGLAAVALSLVILNWPNALGQQVQVTTEGLVPRCTPSGPPAGAKTCNARKGAWVNIQSLREQLKKQGVTVSEVEKTFKLPADGQNPATDVQETFLRATWVEQGRTQSFELPITDALGKAFQARARRHQGTPPAGFEFMSPPLESIFTRAGTVYVDIEMLLGTLLESATLPVEIENPLEAPVLHVGQIKLALGQAQQGIDLSSPISNAVTWTLSREYGATVYQNSQPICGWKECPAKGFTQQIKVSGQPGDVYTILVPFTVSKVNGLNFDLATVGNDGLLRFRTAQPKVRFTGDIKALSNAGDGKAVVALVRLRKQITLGYKAPLWHQVELP